VHSVVGGLLLAHEFCGAFFDQEVFEHLIQCVKFLARVGVDEGVDLRIFV
jgi:hypothetical protein